MKTNLHRLLVALIIGAASPLVAAAGWGALLRNSPAEDFNDEDLRQFLTAAKQVLDAPGPPQTQEWRNAESGAGGNLLVLGRPKVQGFEECRRTRITLYSRKRQGNPSVFTACKDPGGRWLLVGAG
jgi:surface antigen